MSVFDSRKRRVLQLLLVGFFFGTLFTKPLKAQNFSSQRVITDDLMEANHIVAADVTENGRPDVMAGTGQDGDHKLMVFENGNSGFGSGTAIGAESSGAHEVEIADVDGDGDLDIVAASGSGQRLSWYENQGSGSFGDAQEIDGSLFGRAQAVRAADLDGGGDPDVLSSDWSGVYWYENQGGSFGGSQSIGSYDDPDEVAVADLNGDGSPDVIGGAEDNGEIAWHENQGGGSFGSKQQITTEANGVEKIAAADIDGDEDLDLVSASTGGGENPSTVAWYKNQVDGFGARRIIGEGNDGARWLSVADFDGDGRSDVAVASSESNRIGWYRNTGGGFSGFQTITTEVKDPRGIAAADVDGDGDSDVISASREDGKVAWYANQTSSGAGLADTPWPRDGKNVRSTALSSNDGPESAAIKWSFETGSRVDHASIGPEGTIYVGSRDEHVYAIRSDGTQKWSYNARVEGGDAGAKIDRAPAVAADGTIYIGSGSDHIHAIEPDGERKWTNRLVTQRNVTSSPAIVEGGTIYIGTNGGDLYAVNPDGSVKWSFDTGGRTHSPAVASDGTIYVGSGDLGFGGGGDPGAVYAVNPDGTQKWSYQTDAEVKGDPAIGPDGTVYVGDRDGNVYAFNSDGTLAWSFSTNGDVFSDPAIGPNGTVYVGSNDNSLYALGEDGSLEWTFETGDNVRSSPAVGGEGRIYVGSRDGRLYALSPEGAEVWSVGLGGPVGTPAIGGDGRIYVGAGSTFYAIGRGTGDSGVPIAPVADSTQQPGSEFWVDIKVGSDESEVQNLFGTSFTLDYDESRLSIEDDEGGDFLGNDVVYSSNTDATTGEIGIGVSRKSGAGGVDGSGVVARVKFRVDEDVADATTLTFSLREVEAEDPEGGAITLDPEDLVVTVSQGLAVWPGDTNNDGEVDQADVLPLGQYWGATGPSRTSHTCQWQGYSVPVWSPEAAVHADANGDGEVDQADVLCIGQNWGSTHGSGRAAALARTKASEGSIEIRRSSGPGSTVWYELQPEDTGPVIGASATFAFPSERASVVEVEPGPAMEHEALFESRIEEREGTVAVGASRKGEMVSEGSVFARVQLRLEKYKSAGELSVAVREARAGLPSGQLVSLKGATVANVGEDLVLQSPAPSPVQAKGRIPYALPKAMEVRLSLYNALGQEVKVLVTGRQQAGHHVTEVKASELASGLYFLRLEADGMVKTRKVTVVR